MQTLKHIISSFLLLSSFSFAQLKYVGENKGATMFSISYLALEPTNVLGGQINYTNDGVIGIGALYQRSMNPGADAIGVQCEYAIYRPKTELMVGFNLQGAVARSWFSISSYSNPYQGEIETSYYGQSAAIGLEIYLHTQKGPIQFEPFLQVARTFAKVSSSGYSQSSALNSVGVGTDIILGGISYNYLVFTLGGVFQEDTKSAFALNISFVHVIR